MSNQPDNPDQEIEEIASAVQAPAANPETLQPPVKFVILSGRTQELYEAQPGQPMAYFVRTEGTTNTQKITANSIEDMLTELIGTEATDFISGTNTPEVMLIQAENLKAKLEDPAMQQRIRKLHAEQAKLKTDLE